MFYEKTLIEFSVVWRWNIKWNKYNYSDIKRMKSPFHLCPFLFTSEKYSFINFCLKFTNLEIFKKIFV